MSPTATEACSGRFPETAVKDNVLTTIVSTLLLFYGLAAIIRPVAEKLASTAALLKPLP